jgi:rod shape-determining protein MreC
MRQKLSKSNFMVFAAVLMLMSLSKDTSEWLHGRTAALMGDAWGVAADFKVNVGSFFDRFQFSSQDGAVSKTDEVQRLQLINQRLESELRKIQTLLGDDLVDFFEYKFDFIPAEVIFRSPSTWNSSLWVNVGWENNKSREKDIIVKNSPVVVGTSVVGVVDYVGAKQSRIRLITDSGLRPSVRVKRVVDHTVRLLAKGELHGSSQPMWRAEAQVLHGIGFNYDFPDLEGPARDLRTGKPLSPGAKSPSLPIIKMDDLLVTTGLDGVFPAGLNVASITRIKPLKEGDYYFEIEAKPSVENLFGLSFVFILPPVGFDPFDQPSAIGS